MWSWQSIRPGRMVLPDTSVTSASFGQLVAPDVVTASMRSSRTTIATSRTGAAPVPSISVPPRRTFMDDLLRELESVKLRRVLADDLPAHVLGQVTKLLLDVFLRVGPH